MTQTRFVQDRSILDNLFTFSEVSEWAQHNGQYLAVLLDFDKVNWLFLEGTLLRLGFPEAWIRGIASLYGSASSRLIIGGQMGERFNLEHLVHKGACLAPYLFLFFAEAMAHFLRAHETSLQCVRLPIQEEAELLDSKNANDAALYVRGGITMLERVRLALEMFCLVVG